MSLEVVNLSVAVIVCIADWGSGSDLGKPGGREDRWEENRTRARRTLWEACSGHTPDHHGPALRRPFHRSLDARHNECPGVCEGPQL